MPSDEEIWSWIDCFRDRIAILAEAKEIRPREFASTLAGIICFPNKILALQVGDSAAVARKDDEWVSLIWPENGEYASSTFFVTDQPEPKLNILRYSEKYDAFALFSDGVSDLALELMERRPFENFFKPMIAPVDASDDRGRLKGLSHALREYLGGPSICERTDDDKTLILISRT